MKSHPSGFIVISLSHINFYPYISIGKMAKINAPSKR